MKAVGEMIDNEVVKARRALLDALEALGTHREAVILVGAQAIYLRTGSAEVALAEFTTDADLALDPELLTSHPLVEAAMTAAGFTPDPNASALGTWRSRDWVPVDLLVPDAVAGPGRRSVDLPPHGKKTMRRAVGLEAVLRDNDPLLIESFEPSDSRSFTINVAGPAALLVAKVHKVAERIHNPKRWDLKDAHDIYRLLKAIDTDILSASLAALIADSVAGTATRRAIESIRELFAAGEDAPGAHAAGQAEEFVGNPPQVALATSLLAQDLIGALEDTIPTDVWDR